MLTVFSFAVFITNYQYVIRSYNSTMLALSYKYGFTSRALLGTIYHLVNRILPIDMIDYTMAMRFAQVVTALFFLFLLAFAYMCLTGILSIASFVTIAIVVDGQSFASFFQVLVKAFCDTAQELGVSSVWFALFFLLLFFLGFLNALLLFFAGSSIGQLSHRSKGAFGIAATVGLYYASQIVSLIGFFIGSLIYAEKFGTVHNPAPWAMGAGSLLLIFWVAVYYMICRIIVQKHLNLE